MNEELSAQELAKGRTDGRHTIIRPFGRIKSEDTSRNVAEPKLLTEGMIIKKEKSGKQGRVNNVHEDNEDTQDGNDYDVYDAYSFNVTGTANRETIPIIIDQCKVDVIVDSVASENIIDSLLWESIKCRRMKNLKKQTRNCMHMGQNNH